MSVGSLARLSASVGLAAGMACVMAAPLLGQAPAPAGASAGQRPSSPPPGAARPWTPPRTPWGDPDLQGNFTNKYEQGTPFERPDEFAGRKD